MSFLQSFCCPYLSCAPPSQFSRMAHYQFHRTVKNPPITRTVLVFLFLPPPPSLYPCLIHATTIPLQPNVSTIRVPLPSLSTYRSSSTRAVTPSLSRTCAGFTIKVLLFVHPSCPVIFRVLSGLPTPPLRDNPRLEFRPPAVQHCMHRRAFGPPNSDH